MSVHQRSLLGMLTGAGSVVIKTGLNLVLVPVLIAKLGLDVFGLYLLLISVFEISTLLDLGATNALVALLGNDAQTEMQRRAYLKVGHWLLGVLSLLLLGTGLILAPVFTPLFHINTGLHLLAQSGFMLIVIEAALTLYSCYSRSVLLAHCSHQWTNLADSSYSLIANVGALLALLSGGDLTAVLALRLVGAVIRLGMMQWHTQRVEPFAFFPKTPFSLPAAKTVLRLSGHSTALNFSIIVSHKIDDLVIARFLPISAVGMYEIVFRFLGVAIQICLKLCEGIAPLFARMAGLGETDKARLLFLRMSCFLNFVACMLLTLIVLYYRELFGIFSAGKVPVAQTLPVLALALPCVLSGVLQMPANAFLFTWGQQRFLTVTSVLAALANLVLSMTLVHYWGIAGVAAGTLIPQLFQHQGGLIRRTCQALDISFLQYMKAVHGAILIPLLVSICWVQFWKLNWKLIPQEGAFQLLPIGLVSIGALLIGSLLWYKLTATPAERRLLHNLLAARLPRLFKKDMPSPLMVDNA